jgi:hypothetical protein
MIICGQALMRTQSSAPDGIVAQFFIYPCAQFGFFAVVQQVFCTCPRAFIDFDRSIGLTLLGRVVVEHLRDGKQRLGNLQAPDCSANHPDSAEIAAPAQ